MRFLKSGILVLLNCFALAGFIVEKHNDYPASSEYHTDTEAFHSILDLYEPVKMEPINFENLKFWEDFAIVIKPTNKAFADSILSILNKYKNHIQIQVLKPYELNVDQRHSLILLEKSKINHKNAIE